MDGWIERWIGGGTMVSTTTPKLKLISKDELASRCRAIQIFGTLQEKAITFGLSFLSCKFKCKYSCHGGDESSQWNEARI